jgi:hypothetical protein
MAGLLDGQLSKAIYAGFRNKLQKGTLWRATAALSAGLDERGDPNATDPVTWACQGFHDNIDDAYKARAGIPETDSMCAIFAQSLPAGIQPQKDDKLFIAGSWWQLRRVKTDPATALWSCQAFQCQAPS